jgi:hypothetical protein
MEYVHRARLFGANPTHKQLGAKTSLLGQVYVSFLHLARMSRPRGGELVEVEFDAKSANMTKPVRRPSRYIVCSSAVAHSHAHHRFAEESATRKHTLEESAKRP